MVEGTAAPLVAAPDPCAPSPGFSADPVAALLVSLLSFPVGCKRSRGIDGKLFINLPATIGPISKAKKMMNMMK